MKIIFHEKSRTFHLTNGKISYIMEVMANDQLEQLYYGAAIHDEESFHDLHEEFRRSLTTISLPDPSYLSMEYTRQEYPAYGTGDYRMPAYTILQKDGSRISNFVYRSHEIYPGKKPILPLPATYVESEDEAASLEVLLADDRTGTELVLTYTIYRDEPVITRHARFVQKGDETVVLERALSASVEFIDSDFEMLYLNGAWSRERYVKTRRLEKGISAIQSIRGASSSEFNPFLALKRPHTDEQQGEVYGFSLVYSGNFLAQVEVNSMDLTRVTMGIHPEHFSWPLSGGESFQTPEVVMVYSQEGLNGMSQVYHRLYQNRLMRAPWKDRVRPILLNNWEATYFDFNEEKILNIARRAKEAGVELFVLDDGWFGSRNSDNSGLGDWKPNLQKLPEGIRGLSEKIEELGLKFGLWVELEMVNKDSDLYRAHPDWIIGAPGRFESPSRHQHTLDFSRPEVVDAIYEMIAAVLRESKISYIKWDMNRYISQPYSRGMEPEMQGTMFHRYILGVYDLYTRLLNEFPEILFESCASGGARFDAGMMYFAPQTWTSDDTDAAERMKIQYGTSMVYPLVSMGSHVSAVPNHQIHRKTPLATRANVAYFGTFGYELDLNLLTDKEFEMVKEQIQFMKKHRQLIQVDGTFYRLKSPFEGNDTAWIVVSKDKRQALAAYYQRLNTVNASWLRFKLAGLDPDKRYRITSHWGKPDDDFTQNWRHEEQFVELEKTWEAYGDQLMHAGIPLDRRTFNLGGGDFTSVLFDIEEV